jgi:hypothetical protein
LKQTFKKVYFYKSIKKGALFFVVSDSILSFDLFIYEVPFSHPIIMITYYGAQLGIALSVVDSYENHEINHLVIQHHDLINGVQRIYNRFKSIVYEDNIEIIDLNLNEVEIKNESNTTAGKLKEVKAE